MSHAETVKYVYERFSQGDAPAILAKFDSQIEFRLAERHPYNPNTETWIGPDAVVKNFFTKAGREWDDWSVAIDRIFEMTDAVVVEGRYKGIFKPPGKRMDLQVCHVWRFNGDKITSFHQYVDTAGLQDIMKRAGKAGA